MNDSKHKSLEVLSNKLFDTQDLKSPSFDFTAEVMKEVVKLSVPKRVEDTPLISKTAWLIIGGVFSGLLGFAVFGKAFRADGWFHTWSSIKMTVWVPDFSVSKTTLYAIVLFGIMLVIQVPLLKHYFNKRLGD